LQSWSPEPRGQHSKLNCPILLGEELTKQLQLRITQLSAGEINSSDHTAWSGKLPHLKTLIKLVDRTKHYSQANHLVRPHQSFCLYANTRLDARGVTPELTLRPKWHCSWTSCFFVLFNCFLFVCLTIVGFLFLFLFLFSFFFLSVLSTLPTLSSHPYSHPLHSSSFSCAKIHCSPSNYSFCPFSSTLSPCPRFPFPFSSNLSLDYTNLLHTHHLQTNLLYQLYTIPTTCNPWHKHLALQ
jgi:hypothetical protein